LNLKVLARLRVPHSSARLLIDRRDIVREPVVNPPSMKNAPFFLIISCRSPVPVLYQTACALNPTLVTPDGIVRRVGCAAV
jgi:hypothetical protein